MFFKKKKDKVSDAINYTNEDKKNDSYVSIVLNAVRNMSRTFSGDITANGSSRDYNKLFGYGDPKYQDFKNMYEQGGYAGTIVSLIPKLCWRDVPVIRVKKQGDEILEDEITLLKNAGLFKYLERADIANRIGRYSVLFIGVPDGLDPSLPLGEAAKGDFDGLYFTVYEEDGITGTKTDRDPTSKRYGLPTEYTLQSTIDGGMVGENVTSMRVHHSRIIHLAEGAISSKLVGLSSLRQPWRALCDKEKVRGSSAESYYRNSRQKLALETEANFTPSKDPEVTRRLKQNVENFQDGYEDVLRLSGMKANMLQPSIASPREAFDISTEDAAGASRIPVRFLTTKAGGTVTGSEDKASLNATVLDRQEQDCSEWLLDALKVISSAGIFDLPDVLYFEWPVQSALNEIEASQATKNKAEGFRAAADGLSTVKGDEIAASSVFSAIGLDDVKITDINYNDE